LVTLSKQIMKHSNISLETVVMVSDKFSKIWEFLGVNCVTRKPGMITLSWLLLSRKC